jgi:hypothetical protein
MVHDRSKKYDLTQDHGKMDTPAILRLASRKEKGYKMRSAAPVIVSCPAPHGSVGF